MRHVIVVHFLKDIDREPITMPADTPLYLNGDDYVFVNSWGHDLVARIPRENVLMIERVKVEDD